MENFKYISVMKMGNIPPETGEKICMMLSKETLNRLTKKGMDRRLIKPILDIANNMTNGINDKNVNSILDNYNIIARLMNEYCQ